MSTEKHQLRVDVIGHTVVGGHCVANNGWHDEGGGIGVHSIPTPFHQGTKSGKEHRVNHQSDPTYLRRASELSFLPAILCQRQHVAFVFDAGHAVHVLVSRRKNLALQGKEVVFYCCVCLQITGNSSRFFTGCLFARGRPVSMLLCLARGSSTSILSLFSQGGHDVSAACWAFFLVWLTNDRLHEICLFLEI